MNARRLRTLLGAACLLSLLVAPGAGAQLFRAYVSQNGNDNNPCTLQLPCRLLQPALAAIKDGGEIWMLDSANYNTSPVAIGKSVTILAIPGALGSDQQLGDPGEHHRHSADFAHGNGYGADDAEPLYARTQSDRDRRPVRLR